MFQIVAWRETSNVKAVLVRIIGSNQTASQYKTPAIGVCFFPSLKSSKLLRELENSSPNLTLLSSTFRHRHPPCCSLSSPGLSLPLLDALLSRSHLTRGGISHEIFAHLV